MGSAVVPWRGIVALKRVCLPSSLKVVMSSGEQVRRNSGLDQGTNCQRCGRSLPGNATFCGHCGMEVAKAKSINPTTDMNLVAAALALAWLLYTLFWVARPFPAIAVDPIASLRSTVLYTGFWTSLAAPLIALLSFVAFISWRARGRPRLTQFQRDEEVPSPLTITLVAIVWMFVSLAVGSEPGPGLTLGLPWRLFTGALGLVWLVCSVREVRVTWKQPGIRNAARTLAYAVPIPLAAMFVYLSSDAVLESRFELSENALTRYVEEFERTGDVPMPSVQMVGLYLVGPPDQRHGCVRVTTNGEMDYYAGFAHCPEGPLPTKPNEKFEHFRGDWWRFEVHH